VVKILDQIVANILALPPEEELDVNNVTLRLALDITGLVGFAKDFGTTRSFSDAGTDELFYILQSSALQRLQLLNGWGLAGLYHFLMTALHCDGTMCSKLNQINPPRLKPGMACFTVNVTSVLEPHKQSCKGLLTKQQMAPACRIPGSPRDMSCVQLQWDALLHARTVYPAYSVTTSIVISQEFALWGRLPGFHLCPQDATVYALAP
jgi:hypothetical protein